MQPSMRRTASVFVFALALLTAALVAFAPARMPRSGRPRVAATVFPLYDIVRTIAGPDADVTLILPPGAEPHSFEPQPSTVRDIAASGAVYAIGHGLDDWIDAAADSAGTSKVLVDRGIALRPPPYAVAISGGTADQDGSDADPHYWLNARNGVIIAETVAADLSRRYPAHAEGFQARLDAYRTRLLALDDEIRAELAARPQKNIVTFHAAWYYFADAYGLLV
ncbi:MAG: hypothetical protein RLZZ324_871, partial [Candidatus Parcubacteria bacterium]